MGQMRSDADRGSLVRATNRTTTYVVADDADYFVASTNKAALDALVVSGASMTILRRAPMIPSTIAFSAAQSSPTGIKTVFRIRGFGRHGDEVSEVFTHEQYAGVRQTALAYMWLSSIEVLEVGPNVLSFTVGYNHSFGSSNPGVKFLIPGRPQSASEFEVLAAGSIGLPVKVDPNGTGYDPDTGLYHATYLSGPQLISIVVHPDAC